MEEEQELMLKLSIFEQQMKQIHQQLQAVEQAVLDVNTIKIGLDELKNSKGKEILAPIGRGIFVETKLLSEKLIVDVGGRNFVTKDIESTKNIIQEQTEKLEKTREQLEKMLEEINEELTRTYIEHQNKKEKKKKIDN